MLFQKIPPEQILWQEAQQSQMLLEGLSGQDQNPIAEDSPPVQIRVPREFAELAWDVFHHRSGERFAVLYRLLWRLSHGERNLLKVEVDDDVRQAKIMQRQVNWDAHRMSWFVRFEKTSDELGDLYLAWYRPDHSVLRLVAGNFVRRFGNMRWSILTPDESAHWDMLKVQFGPGVSTAPSTPDQLVSLWQTYYASTYNPQRDNPKLFRQHIPTRFLRDMPEGKAKLPGLSAPRREISQRGESSAMPPLL